MIIIEVAFYLGRLKDYNWILKNDSRLLRYQNFPTYVRLLKLHNLFSIYTNESIIKNFLIKEVWAQHVSYYDWK